MINTLPKSIIEAARKILTESHHPMIDGEVKHSENINESINRPYTEDDHGKAIVYDNGEYKISVNDPHDASFIALWHSGKKVGSMYLGNGRTSDTKGYATVRSVDIDKKHQGNGMGKKLYDVALNYSHEKYKGISSEQPDRVNKKQVPAILRRMGGKSHESGDITIDRNNQMINNLPKSLIDTARDILEAVQTDEQTPSKLHHVAEIKTNFPDADYYVTRKGSMDAVGKITNEFSPEHIGVKITRTDLLHPKYHQYAMQYAHMNGYWKGKTKGSLSLQHISVNDVKNMPFIYKGINESFYSGVELPQSLIGSARKILTESQHPMIDVDGKLKHKTNSEGALIHPTDEGIKNFHRWFGDSDSVDDHGRPKVFHHGAPALYNHQTEKTPLPFNEFKHSGSGVVSFSPTHNFAEQYASTKSMDAGLDMAPFVFKTYLKTKTFDPNNKDHIQQVSEELGPIVKHSGKYGWSAFGGEISHPKDQFLERLQGIHDVYRPLTKEMHENAVVGKIMPLDGGRIFVHHKTPTKLYFSDSYQMDSLKPEHIAELKAEAQKEPEETVKKEFKFARHESRPWDLLRKKVSINHITWVPAKAKGDNWEYTENDELHGAMKKLGFNAIKQTERKNENVAVLDKGQIKSATHNKGTFSHPTHIDE